MVPGGRLFVAVLKFWTTVGLSVNEAVATGESENPLAVAMALIVVAAVIAIGVLYTADDVPGVEPSVV
jgi:hypothetical protein